MAGAAVHPPPTPLFVHPRPCHSPSFTQPRHFHLSRPTRVFPRPTVRCCAVPPNVPKPDPGSKSDAGDIPKVGYRLSSTPARLLRRIGGDLRVDGVVMEIASIALPAVLALAADPLTSLVDTAFVGHLGSVELAAVGVSISVFNLVAKLFNVPLLNITTSFVAEEKALDAGNKDSKQSAPYPEMGVPPQNPLFNSATQGKKHLPAISASLVLAAGIGIIEAVALFFGSGVLVDIMGVAVDSPMRMPAQHFLALRALGAPAIVTALAAQGTFRGFMDTKTPLYAVGIGNLLNAVLDPILMFTFGLGIDGAAIATIIADYLIAFILLWKLDKEVVLIPSDVDVQKVIRYLKSGALLIGRTIAVVGTMTLSTSLAARRGPIPMAGHEICLQVWLAISLLNDALALAGQALLASEYAKGNYEQARTIIYRILQIGLTTGLSLALILFIGFGSFCSLFTTDIAVLEIARSGILFVTASQPVNALAFVLDGLYYGVSDFAYAAYSMVLVGFTSSWILLVVAPSFGLAGVWAGLFVFMVLRVVAGFLRLGSKSGPWKLIWSEVDTNMKGK